MTAWPDGDQPLWEPSAQRIAECGLTSFRAALAGRGIRCAGYPELHEFSVQHPGEFWAAVWEFCDVVGDPGDRPLIEAGADSDAGYLPGARFFPDASLNVARTLLRGPGDDSAPAILAATESSPVMRIMSWGDLRGEVARCARALAAAGIGRGDRVAGWLPNVPEAVVAMLASACLGAIWSSTSPDFGVAGVLDRFGQISPAVLIVADGYRYGGREHDCLGRLAQLRAGLPSVHTVVLVPCLGTPEVPAGVQLWSDFLSGGADVADGEPPYADGPFGAPLAVLYSSGTTGAPKALIHTAGGLLLKHLEEHRLQCDVRPGDRVFYYTTTGWMMWNWLAGALASAATIVLYDGSPVWPSGSRLWDLADEAELTFFGTSAKYLDAVAKTGLRPRDSHRLAALRTVASTGSPLLPEGFDYVYDAVKADVHLASISGGTDICGCFVMGNPTAPVWRGEIQAAALGMAVDVYDESGQSLPPGQPGELVCTKPFPSMPAGLWGDEEGARYRSAYFADFGGVWRHGDWIARTGHGGWVISGRSDATLNPGGVRIGTAEIYRQVETLPEIAESLAVGQDWDGDVRVVLFVRLAAGAELTEELAATIRARIRQGCTPRHVPARIVAVADLPRTRSGKLAELPVRDVVNGRPVRALAGLANPGSLDLFRDLPELSE